MVILNVDNMTERERLNQINIASELFREGLISSSEYTRSISNINSEIIKNKTNNSEMKQGLKIEYINKSSAYGDYRYYVYYVDGMAVFMANQIPWPNCCGIAILKDLSISSSVDKTIFKKILDEICEDLYSNDKYSKLLFYTNIGSVSRMFETHPEVTILDPFKNRRSGNILIGFEINLLKDSDVNPESIITWRSAIDEEDEEDTDDDDDFEEEEDEIDHTIRQIADSVRTPRTVVTRGDRMPTGIFRSSDNS